MYHIISSWDEPDIDYMRDRIQESTHRGIAIHDISDLYKSIAQAKEAAAINMRNLYYIANPNSYQQLATYLENNMTSTIEEVCLVDGKLSTKADKMKILAKMGYQFAIDLLTYRRAKKYEETLRSILSYKDNGFVRPKVSLGKTNRVNYSEPALMNIPKKLLWNIVAPRKPGNLLISVDIKNQEPWILINMLGIEKLKTKLSYDDKNGLYNTVFAELYGRQPTPLERTEFKTAWNALTYGSTKQGMLLICKNIDGEKLYNYFKGLKEFTNYREKCYAMAKRKKQTVETYFGTVLYANELGKRLQRVLMDLPIQGTGADILALLIKHVDEEFEKRGLDDVMDFYFSRHDELIFEVDGEYANRVGLEKVFDELRDITEHQVDDWAPFHIEIKLLQPEEVISLEEDDDEDSEDDTL